MRVLKDFNAILERGHKYDPAWTHYHKRLPLNFQVDCDNCQATNIKVSYGVRGDPKDLCPDCYERLRYNQIDPRDIRAMSANGML